jgi:hypothetical protein
MIEKPMQKVALVLEREAVESRWETHRWRLVAATPDMGGDVREIVLDAGARLHRIHPGIELILYRDEAEGYYLNVSSDEPSVFVALRVDEASGDPYPFQATLSYNEAARWMDSSERVERVALWPEIAAWMGDWVAENYKPEPKKRRRPRSFEGKEGRLRERSES